LPHSGPPSVQVRPPSTGRVTPVTKAASSPARQARAEATSSGRAARRSGMRSHAFSRSASPGGHHHPVALVEQVGGDAPSEVGGAARHQPAGGFVPPGASRHVSSPSSGFPGFLGARGGPTACRFRSGTFECSRAPRGCEGHGFPGRTTPAHGPYGSAGRVGSGRPDGSPGPYRTGVRAPDGRGAGMPVGHDRRFGAPAVHPDDPVRPLRVHPPPPCGRDHPCTGRTRPRVAGGPRSGGVLVSA
jgi:hypothetical protein